MAASSGSKEPKKSRFGRGGGGATKATASKEPGRGNQLIEVFKQTRQNDPAILLWILGAFFAVFLVCELIGIALGHPWYWGFIGVLLGIVAALFVFGRRAQAAAYKSIAGQPGAGGAAMTGLKRGWRVEQEPVAAEMGRSRQVKDLSSAALVYRAVGKPGVVLVGEGPKGSVGRLLESERKKTARVLGPEVPVTLMRLGQDEDAVPVDRLSKDMQKLPKVLTDAEIDVVTRRLRALGGQRPPIPAGVDPTKARVNRSAMRGR